MRGVVVWLVGTVLLVGAVGAHARNDSHLLNLGELAAEITMNRKMAAYVGRNGLPDIAEWRFLSDAPPWDEHEVVLYYFDHRKEISFARAWILGDPSIHLERFERPLSDDDIAAMMPYRDSLRRGSSGRRARAGGPAERAEAAATRAEAAATRIETAADATELAADRTEAIVAKMEVAAAPKPKAKAKARPRQRVAKK